MTGLRVLCTAAPFRTNDKQKFWWKCLKCSISGGKKINCRALRVPEYPLSIEHLRLEDIWAAIIINIEKIPEVKTKKNACSVTKTKGQSVTNICGRLPEVSNARHVTYQSCLHLILEYLHFSEMLNKRPCFGYADKCSKMRPMQAENLVSPARFAKNYLQRKIWAENKNTYLCHQSASRTDWRLQSVLISCEELGRGQSCFYNINNPQSWIWRISETREEAVQDMRHENGRQDHQEKAMKWW